MILYFSATGNSEYAAKRIGKETDDDVTGLFERIRSGDYSEIHSQRPWVIVAPTYAWRIPRILQQWLKRTSLSGNREIYFVMTCGGSIGNAGKYLEKLCAEKKMNYRGCMKITMPENYIALFTTPTAGEAAEIIRQAETVIDGAARFIRNEDPFPQPKITLGDKISSGIVNRIFYPMFVHAKKFYATDRCISCGKCAEVCPTDAIHLTSLADKSAIQIGHAVWIKENCVPLTDGVECGNCARHCPTGAIQMVVSDPDMADSPKIPVVNAEKCIGCGACENLCPSRPFSAIYVTGHQMHRII